MPTWASSHSARWNSERQYATVVLSNPLITHHFRPRTIPYWWIRGQVASIMTILENLQLVLSVLELLWRWLIQSSLKLYELAVIINPYYMHGNWGMSWLSKMPSVTRLADSTFRTQTTFSISWAQKLQFWPLHIHIPRGLDFSPVKTWAFRMFLSEVCHSPKDMP